MSKGEMAHGGVEYGPEARPDAADATLIRLCAEFVRRAEARTLEGDRLDGLPWSSEVNAGYLELSRGAHGYGAMLAAILATTPTTIPGLVAKAQVISRHQQDRDAEPIPASILAEDVLALHGAAARCVGQDAAEECRVGWCPGGHG
jgi:hypothetical protein